MYEERDKKRFRAFTEALLKAGRKHPGIQDATRDLCGAIFRVTVSSSRRFDDAKSDLTSSVYALDSAIQELHEPVRNRVRSTAPLFLSELRCAHEPRLRNVCGGVAGHAVSVWLSRRRIAKG